MAHSHTHHHDHSNRYSRVFAIGIGLNVIFVAVEVFYGLLANSSALLADAGHNASDVLSLVFAWTAASLATTRPTGEYTYGLRKTTILVSILNALLLFVAMVFIAWDAIGKIRSPEPVASKQVILVAGIGVMINTATALLFMKGRREDLNIKGAFLHMAADAGVSLGVVVAGLLIQLTGIFWIDSLTSFLIIAVVLWGTWSLFTDSLKLALDAVPANIKIDEVRTFLETQQGVTNVHDLHIWAMSTTHVALTAHLVMPDGNNDAFLAQLQEDIEHQFGIGHTTFQIEKEQMEANCQTDC